MGSVTIADLLQAHNLLDFPSVTASGNGDDGPGINSYLVQIAAMDRANGLAFLPPGTYRIATPIVLPSNITLFGFGDATILRLGNSANVDVIQADGASNIRIKDLRIDGNRANNTSGNGIGVFLNHVTDAWLENVNIVSCRADGFQLQEPVRVELRGCSASDCGRHGFALNAAEFCLLFACRGFNNSQVSDAGDGDAIQVDILSHDNAVIGALGYETALTGDRQGYGFRELLAGGCYQNELLGGAYRGNRTAPFLAEPDSQALSYIGMAIGSLGLGTQSPDASALLDLVATTRGMGIPAMTTIQRDAIASPRAGLAIYNTTTGKLNIRVAAAWEAVTSV